MIRSTGLAVLLVVGLPSAVPAAALAQACRRDELRFEIPAGPEGGSPTSLVRVERSGRDPFDGPSGGTCVVRGREIVHVPDGERRDFEIAASDTELVEMRIGRERLHVSMPTGSELHLVSSACAPWRLEGPDLDVHDEHGTRGASPSSLWFVGGPRQSFHTPYGGACGTPGTELGPPELACHIDSQAGWCAPTVLRIGAVRHTFWLRSGERWSIAVRRGRVTGTR